MKPVETYTTVEKKDLQEVFSTGDYLKFQGENILFTQGSHGKDEAYLFLKTVFPFIGKIAVRDASEKVLLISNRFTPDVIEPFINFEDVTETFKDNLEKMSEHISYGYKDYAV